MKILLSIIVLLLTLQSSGQSINEIKQLLADKDFKFFKKYTNSNSNSNVTVIWLFNRDITPTFQECVIDIDESFSTENNSDNSTILHYRINILAKSNEIIYYDFALNENNNSVWDVLTFKIMDSFRNEKLLTALKQDFYKTYNDSLHQQELFDNSYVYGSSCKIARIKPKLRKENDLLVQNKDSAILTNWLKSTNTEKQVYGIDGLYQLKINGYKFTAEQLQLIKIIKSKKGTIFTCDGCVNSSLKISKVVKAILSGHPIL